MERATEIHERDREQRRVVDVYADRLEALTNLAFLMRVDIDHQEKLEEYLRYMDTVLDGMKDDEALLSLSL
jgi:hypothetical protein